MKNYKLVIFDMDGTLADTSPGIYDAHRYTLAKLGIPLWNHMLDHVIGPALLDIYANRFGLPADQARTAVDIYRERYKTHGIHMANLYPGMEKLLTDLQAAGKKTAVATLKLESFAHTMLTEMGAAPHMDFIFGMDAADKMNKQLLLIKCCEAANVSIEDAVLIGDSTGDSKGSNAVGMDLIGVTYGFGFHTDADVKAAGGIASAASCEELDQMLIF